MVSIREIKRVFEDIAPHRQLPMSAVMEFQTRIEQIMNEFAETAPDNITPLVPPEGIMSKYKTATDDMTDAQKDDTLSDFMAQSDRVYKNFVTKALIDLQNASKSDQQQMVKAIIERKGMFKYLEPEDAKKLLDSVDDPGAGTVESIAERLAADEGVDVAETILPTKPIGPKEEGISSLFKKDESGLGFDDRGEAAEFIRKMRGAGIKNEDIRKIFKENPPYKRGSGFLGQDRDKMILDLEPGKRAATTLARAADMNADTKIKQELLSELDEMKLDKGPRFFNEEYMGYDDFISAINAKKIEVNNAIVDDLEAMGVSDEIITDIMGMARRQKEGRFYISGEEFIDTIKEELDFNDIKYDVDFYKKYFRELDSLMKKPEPRFMYGGVV